MSAQQSDEEKRRFERKSLSAVIPVTDMVEQAEIGHIGNISDGGLMLITYESMVVGSIHQLSFTLRNQSGEAFAFDVGTQCLWCSEASTPGRFWAGFEIIDINPEQQNQLHKIITKSAL